MSNDFLFMAIAFAIVGILQLIWMELRRIRRLLERRPGVVAGVGERPVTPDSEPRIGSTERGPDILESGAGEVGVDRELDPYPFANRTWFGSAAAGCPDRAASNAVEKEEKP